MVAAPTEIRPLVIRLAIGLAMVVLITVAAITYTPGLGGVFVFDSVERVIQNDALRISSLDAEQLLGAAYAAQASYPQRGLAYITLALNYYLSGQQFDPFAFKSTNLVIHVLNGLLVLILAGLILSRWHQRDVHAGRRIASLHVTTLAVIATSLWLLHPIQLTSVLYVVQRMTSLSATLVLAGAIGFVVARVRFQRRESYALAFMYGSVVFCTGVGFLFKQSALLLPAYIAVLELFVFDRESLSPAQKRRLLSYFAVTLVIPLVLGVVAVLAHPDLLIGGYEGRDFTMWQRVMTQARVLFFYLSLLLIPDIRRFGLYHDDLTISSGLLDPLSTALALIGWALILISIVWGARRQAPWAFAAAWFVVGHAMESTILPLEQVHEHRNYAPSVGIWIAVGHYVGFFWERAGRLRALVLTAVGVWFLALALLSHMRAQSWQNPAALMESLARHHPQSYRSTVAYAFNSIPVSADLSIRFDAFKRAAELDGRVVVPLIEMAKIASALQRFIDNGEVKFRSVNANGARMPIGEMNLLADTRHNARLLAALDNEIIQRLTMGPVRTDSVIALIGLVDCALNGDQDCIVLQEGARLWHDSALANPRLPPSYKAALELSVAKIHASAGDHDAAVRHARRAGELSPDNLAYRLQEATLYAVLERWGNLGVVLDEIARRFPVRADSDSTFQDLRARHARAAGDAIVK